MFGMKDVANRDENWLGWIEHLGFPLTREFLRHSNLRQNLQIPTPGVVQEDCLVGIVSPESVKPWLRAPVVFVPQSLSKDKKIQGMKGMRSQLALHAKIGVLNNVSHVIYHGCTSNGNVLHATLR
jgi:hypothetical protein